MSPIRDLELLAGVPLVALILWDAFETIVLPRTVRRRYRLTRVVVLGSWMLWRSAPLPSSTREGYLSFFGPLVLLFLVFVWAIGLVFGFALVLHGLRSTGSLGSSVYFSGSTFFTLGLGDVVPKANASRAVVLLEAGMGFGFLAMVISYLPIYYQAFSRREIAISLLDARAGSPPTALELLRRNGRQVTAQTLVQWEAWTAELLESHLSYPILAFFRSQHDKQSWLSALTVILDTCALAMTGIEAMPEGQARFTFAIARHALVDLTQIFYGEPQQPQPDRLDHVTFERLSDSLAALGMQLSQDAKTAESSLKRLRTAYEPFAFALSKRLLLNLPPWIPDADQEDDWQVSPWDKMPPL
jgi:hypothetical protein